MAGFRSIGLGLWMLLPLISVAKTQSGAVPRNLVIDGMVGALAVPGSNNGDWESDERLGGRPGEADWFLTWDSQFLYLARSGGDNQQPSVVYLHVDFAGAAMSNQPVGWGGLNPSVAAMGGINAMLVLHPQYDFFHVFSSNGWSMADSSLSPSFGLTSQVHQMEIAIPWTSIIGSSLTPQNLRMYLAQYMPDGLPLGCPAGADALVAVSPWGTGAPGNGPMDAVNDGMGPSIAQPEGCLAGLEPITRWWGCYPVVGLLSPDSWTLPLPNAGRDTVLCESASAFFLTGNPPPSGFTGRWEVVAHPPNASPTLLDSSSFNTLLQGLTATGFYQLAWHLDGPGCTIRPDTVRIQLQPFVPQAIAMSDSALVCDSTAIWLRALISGPFGGTWTQAAGQGFLVNPDSTDCRLQSLSSGESKWVWTVTGGACPSTSDTVILFVSNSLVAQAGPDQDLCGVFQTFLQAEDPSNLQPGAWGQWYPIDMQTNVFVREVFNPSSEFFNLVPGSYFLEWRIRNGTCPQRSDTVRIRVFDPLPANAGPDLLVCNDSAVTLLAPPLVDSLASGYWVGWVGPSQVLISDVFDPQAMMTGLVEGEFQGEWVRLHGICGADTDMVKLRVAYLQANGIDSVNLPNQGESNGWVQVAEPWIGTPPFLYSLEAFTFQTDPVLDNLASGAYIITIMDGWGCTDTLQFFLPESEAPPPGEMDSLFVPTGFSPNGDGVNDNWAIRGLDATNLVKVSVYSSWGTRVFHAEETYLPWDGLAGGSPLPNGTYYFVIEWADGTIRKGPLTLMR